MARSGESGSPGGQAGGAQRLQQGAQGAGQAGRQVVQSAVQHGGEVAQEARRTTRDLFGQAQTELKDQAGAQQKRAADGLRSIGDQLRSMAEKNDRPGMAGDLIGEFSGRVQHAADWLDHHEPGQVVAEVRDFARRHPGAFLLGAAVAGVLVGRLTRGVAGDGHGQWQHQQARESSGPPAPNPGAPAASPTAPEMRP